MLNLKCHVFYCITEGSNMDLSGPTSDDTQNFWHILACASSHHLLMVIFKLAMCEQTNLQNTES